ncbi:MAG: site-2 protease family protein [Elusimicrobiota bacterium]|jgi:Zn-dependent protease|nr:site-2 protease family protein [Elusimicrobiota bacterium]
MDVGHAVVLVVILIFSVMIHEIAHGLAAYWRGDDTAFRMGRITLNPIAHIELMGSIILPLFMILMHSPFIFGWAKPVPVNYNNLYNPKRDFALTALAGPCANFLLAIICSLIVRLVYAFFSGFALSADIINFAMQMIMVNIMLGLLNLLPIPPLDGSRVITLFMSENTALRFLSLNPFACFIILIVLISSGVFARIVEPVFYFIFRILMA